MTNNLQPTTKDQRSGLPSDSTVIDLFPPLSSFVQTIHASG